MKLVKIAKREKLSISANGDAYFVIDGYPTPVPHVIKHNAAGDPVMLINKKDYKVCRLVAEAFIDGYTDECIVHYIDECDHITQGDRKLSAALKNLMVYDKDFNILHRGNNASRSVTDDGEPRGSFQITVDRVTYFLCNVPASERKEVEATIKSLPTVVDRKEYASQFRLKRNLPKYIYLARAKFHVYMSSKKLGKYSKICESLDEAIDLRNKKLKEIGVEIPNY